MAKKIGKEKDSASEIFEDDGGVLKQAEKPRKKRRAIKRKSAREIFEESEALAATVIVEMMLNDSSSNSLKVDCAKEILTRLHGKTFEESDTFDLSEVLPFEVKDFCD